MIIILPWFGGEFSSFSSLSESLKTSLFPFFFGILNGNENYSHFRTLFVSTAAVGNKKVPLRKIPHRTVLFCASGQIVSAKNSAGNKIVPFRKNIVKTCQNGAKFKYREQNSAKFKIGIKCDKITLYFVNTE